MFSDPQAVAVVLGDNFLTAAKLGICTVEREALVRVLGMLDRGEIPEEKFDMGRFGSGCGSVGCLCGWAHTVEPAAFSEVTKYKGSAMEVEYGLKCRLPGQLLTLFWVGNDPAVFLHSKPSMQQAARALRNFLTTGNARWQEVFKG